MRKLPFALALKKDVARAHNITLEQLDQNKPKYRAELQSVGNGRRDADPDYWIKRWYAQYRLLDSVLGPAGVVVVTDCRYPNEAQFLAQLCGLVLRVDTPRRVRLARGLAYDSDYLKKVKKYEKHPSEKMVLKCQVHGLVSGTLTGDFIPAIQGLAEEYAGTVPSIH